MLVGEFWVRQAKGGSLELSRGSASQAVFDLCRLAALHFDAAGRTSDPNIDICPRSGKCSVICSECVCGATPAMGSVYQLRV